MIPRPYITVVVTLLLALMLSMLPLPDWANYARPDWLTLVLIYWVMALPLTIGVTVAFIFGLLLDVSQSTLLGHHALALIVVIFLVQQLYQRIRVYTLIQQAMFVGILLIIKQLIVLWISGITDNAPDTSLYFLPSLIGAIIWPWLFILLRDIRRRFCQLEHH
ncbi:MAG: rod shape-determining protein MreD [Gammaproteobacteria bacterium]|nr:rod shape-determining protein MreD [Gammaproteobacteria bacterium]